MLAQFKKTEEELKTDKDRWLYALKEKALQQGSSAIPAYKKVHSWEKATGEDKGLAVFYEALKKRDLDQKLQKEYERQLTLYNQNMSRVETLALEKGRQETLTEVVLNMIGSRVDDKIILKTTGLRQKELEELKASQKSVEEEGNDSKSSEGEEEND